MSAHTLLLVDDDPAVHELLAVVLRPPEWRIDSAYDGLEGLARAKERAYDVVLTDVGDDQSLRTNLSTFSAHVRNLAAILGCSACRSSKSQKIDRPELPVHRRRPANLRAQSQISAQ